MKEVVASWAGLVPREWEPRRLFSETTQDGAKMMPTRLWQSLFDGKTLTGWTVEDKPELWAVENGAIRCKGMGGGYLRSNEQYENFSLALEFNIDKGTNSGVFVRWSDIKDPVNTGIEVQVIDSAAKVTPDKHDSGAIYDLVAPTRNTMRPAGEWNQLVIFCLGPRLTVRLNGARVSEINFDEYTEPSKNPDRTPNKFKYAMSKLPRKGYIGFQNHGGGVWYRNIILTPVKMS